MDGLLAGVDVGTTHVKLVVTDLAGGVVARRAVEHATWTGPSGEVEQDPEDWWRGLRSCLDALDVDRSRIVAVGLTGQMQDVVVCRDDLPVRPALLYSDLRAVVEHETLRDRLPGWDRTTRNLQDAFSVAAKLAWLRDAEGRPGGDEHVLLGGPGFLMARMTGRRVVDPVTASTTGLLDIERRAWADDVLAAISLPADRLPELADDAVAPLRDDAASHLGLPPGIPVVHALGDAGATTDGLVGSEPGSSYLHLGTTGWFASVVRGLPDEASATHALAMPGGRTSLRIGAVLSAGSTSRWSRDTFHPGTAFDELDAMLAGRVADATHRPLCLPGLAGERTPVRDAALRGAFVGVDPATDAADLHLAALTGVAMGLRHAADDLGWHGDHLPVVGGGSASPVWRQVVADVFGVPVSSADVPDAGAWSALRSAARAAGTPALPTLESRLDDVVPTRPSAAAPVLARRLSVHRALYDALVPICRRL